MSTSPTSALHGCKSPLKNSMPVILILTLSLYGCSSIKTPESIKKIRIPDSIKQFSLPKLGVGENDPAFRKRVYAGGGFGRSAIKPDTSGTVFNVSNSSAMATQFRLGADLHNRWSVELDTSVLGKAQFDEGHNTDVSYTAASISALFYGLTGNRNRSTKVGFSGFGKLGYGIVQHGSIVEPFDYSENSIMLGLGAEYGFQNGFAVRSEVTRMASDATVFGIGGIYRFGMAPSSIGRVFANAAAPALGAANARTEVRNGRVYSTTNDQNSPVNSASEFNSDKPVWVTKVSEEDLDGDGINNSDDHCKNSPLNSTVSKYGCGLFDAILSDVTFKPGSNWLTPRARGSLDKVALTLLAFPEARVQVQAHTDSQGHADDNLGLSVQRAESVVTYLKDKGIGGHQLETLGLGESKPLDTNDTKAGRQRNRRVELLTLANLDPAHMGGADPKLKSQTAPSLGAANAVVEVAESLAIPQSPALPSGPQFEEPVFPSISGVKIEPLPRSKFVAGLSLGGVLQDVTFVEGTTTLTDAANVELRSVSQELKRFPNVRLVVMGHTDNTLSPEKSRALSIKQANSVVSFLVSEGVDAARLSVEGFGSSLPLAQNVTEADRRRNQRIELRVVN